MIYYRFVKIGKFWKLKRGVFGEENTNTWDFLVLAVYHKCHEKSLSNVLKWFHHKQATQSLPNETPVRLRQHWGTPQLLSWSETCVLNFYIIQTSRCSQLPHWVNWLFALLIRPTVFEITCCNFGTGCLTVGQDATKIAKSNLEEYITPGLYIRSMHLHTEKLNESFRKN